MLEQLTAHELSLSLESLCAALAENPSLTHLQASEPPAEVSELSWLGQPVAERAAKQGLAIPYAGFHLVVVAEEGHAVDRMMLKAMHQAATERLPLPDRIFVYNFDVPEKPVLLHVRSGGARSLRHAFEGFVRHMAKSIGHLFQDGQALEQVRPALHQALTEQLEVLNKAFEADPSEMVKFKTYLARLKHDFLEHLEIIHAHISNDNESVIESVLGRYRINVLVGHEGQTCAPVIYDQDPSIQSLFGGVEGSSENGGGSPDFMRLRAGNVLHAHGGFLMMHLRDVLADEQNGMLILEKLHRLMRSGHIRIEDASSNANQSVAMHTMSESLSVEVKLVLIATPEEYYTLHEEHPSFAQQFKIKIELEDPVLATSELYQALSRKWTAFAKTQANRTLTPKGIARLILYLHRQAESQQRICPQWQLAETLLLETAAHHPDEPIDAESIERTLELRAERNCLTEQQWRNAIIDGEILVNVHGRAVGQINGLTHVDMGDFSFGSPVRISARCYAGEVGVVNIDREIQMTGASHDKGLLILKHWLSASFAHLTPLSLNASLVFEQEYQGVDGDSATCAELFALLSAIAGLSLPQGIAVTGAMNQHGEVMAVGGLNEKIEGYFQLCKTLGLNGSQGVLIPSRNLSHLLLSEEVIQAVDQQRFQIYAMDHVLEGMEFLTGLPMGHADSSGHYSSETLMGRVERALEEMRKTMAENKPNRLH